MNPRHPGWWLLPIFGIAAGVLFRASEDPALPSPASAEVESRVLFMPDGRALRFLRGPGMTTFLSLTEIPESLLQDFQPHPLSHEEAQSFCRWLSDRSGTPLRLPSAAEWRSAARAGVDNAEFAWGFGPADPPASIHFALGAPPQKPGPALGVGFRDLAGGLWEWTAEGILLGSAWSESNPETLRIDFEWQPPVGYRGRDAGLRLAWD